MNITKANNLACPIDRKPLEFRNKQLVCENGHVFDIARQGHVNLLPVQHKRTKQPGDSKEMVVARTKFLNSGLYAPVAKKLSEIVLAQIASTKSTSSRNTCLMDAGCGEGHYLDAVFKALDGRRNSINPETTLSFIGLDISKPAIIEAAKRNKHITWIVGTNRQPPVADASVDIILCVFGFQSFEGFNKILKTGGIIVLVEPGADHLSELREIIYKEVKKSDPPDLSHLGGIGFSLVDTQSLRFKTGMINTEQINNLLLMTPHLYRATKEGKEAASHLKGLDLTVDVVFRILEKHSG